jgi:aspartokinase
MMISAKLQSLDIDQEWVDARKLIATNSNHGNAAVDLR